MSKRIYEETAVIRQLNTHSDVFVIPATKTIELMVNHACGIKTWGKLDAGKMAEIADRKSM